MRRSKAAGAVALFAGAALVLSACGGGGSGDQNTGSSSGVNANAVAKGESGDSYTAPKVQQQASNGQVVVTTDQAWFAYNGAESDNADSYNTYANTMVLSGAFSMDGNNKVLLNKDLMDSVDVTSTSPYTVTWKINPKAVWSDGQPVSCDDFYLDWLADSGFNKTPFKPATSAGYQLIKQPKCASKDDKTFTTVFSQPYLDYKGLFGSTSSGDLLPAHIVEQKTGVSDISKLTPSSDAATLKKVADFWNGTTGWKPKSQPDATMPSDGPYMFAPGGYTKDVQITLVRNPKWWGNPGGPAKIILKANSDVSGQVTALRNGDTDAIASAHPSVDAATSLRGLTSQGYTYGAAPGLNFEHLDLNYKNQFLKDDAVRKAFFQCVNRNELVNKIVKGVESDAKPYNDLLFFPGQPGYADNYSDKSLGDANKAAQTLQADGYKKDSNGFMAKNGQELKFRISHTDIPSRKDTVKLIQGECGKNSAAGMNIVDDTDPNFLSDRVSKGDYDVALFAWSTPPFLSSNLAEYQTNKNGNGGENWSSYSDSTVDNDLSQASQQTDASKAQDLYADAAKHLASDYYSLPLFLTPQMWAYKTNTIDKTYMQGFAGLLWNANEWVVTK
ncbi:MAG: ABC transporter family substrate-binding protein [Sciscionella sp.]|nr:ABC transporter family substrate-binding protein [Sciscionella sp.]